MAAANAIKSPEARESRTKETRRNHILRVEPRGQPAHGCENADRAKAAPSTKKETTCAVRVH